MSRKKFLHLARYRNEGAAAARAQPSLSRVLA